VLPWIFLLALLSPAEVLSQEPPTERMPEEPPRLRLDVDAWDAVPSGWIFITRGSQPGSATRARDGHEVGLDPEVLPTGNARLRFWDSTDLGFRVVPVQESGTHTASGDFVYHGQTYAGGRQIRSDVGVLLLALDVQRRWEASDWLSLTPHLGAEYWGFSSHLRTVDGLAPIDERRSFSSGYWLAGADAEVRLTESLRGQVSCLGGLTGSSRYFIEAEAGMALHLNSWASLTATYRLQNLRFHTSTNEANLLFQGPAAGLELRF